MFPPEAFGVGVTVAELRPAPLGRRSRCRRGWCRGRPGWATCCRSQLMTPEQKAAQLQRVEEAEAVLAAFKAELVVGLAADRPASGDRQRGQVGRGVGGVGGPAARRGRVGVLPRRAGPGPQLLPGGGDAAVGAVDHVAAAAAGHLGGAGGRVAGLAESPGDRRRARLAGPRVPGRRARRGRGGGAAAGHRAVDHPAACAGAGGADQGRPGRRRPPPEEGRARRGRHGPRRSGTAWASCGPRCRCRRRRRCAPRWTRTPAR